MSCPPEVSLALYLDEALEPEEVRSVESHLVGCGDCRRRVVELQGEVSLLRNVLHEQVREPRTVAASEDAPSLAWSLPAAIAAVTVALTVIGTLFESRLPGALDLLHPRRLKGAFEMSFDLIFLLRESAPGLVELTISLAVVASISALGSFVVSVLYRRVYGTAATLALALCLTGPDPAQAIEVLWDTDTQIRAGETIEETLLLEGEAVVVDGTIQGDLIVGAERVSIGGRVEGNVYALSRDLEITGVVTGTVHGVVEHMRIDGSVGGVYMLGERFTLAPGGTAARDVGFVGNDAVVEGTVARDVVFGGERLELRGQIGRNVTARWADRVHLRDGTDIVGDVDATMETGVEIDRAPGASIGGEVRTHPFEFRHDHYLTAYTKPGFYLWHGVGFVAALCFGVLLQVLAPRLYDSQVGHARAFFRSMGIGFVALVVTPVAAVLVACTLIGIPIAILAAFVYVFSLYTAEILVGGWIGMRLLPPRDTSILAFSLTLFVGLGLLTIVGHLPFLGPPVSIVSLLFGMGMLTERLRAGALRPA